MRVGNRLRGGRAAVVALLGLTVLGTACAAPHLPPGPYQLTNPARITVAAPDMGGVQVKITDYLWDSGGFFNYNTHSVCNTPPGEMYPIGETVVECSSTHPSGRVYTKPTTVVVTPPNGDRIVKIDRGWGACAVYQQGSVRCWGGYAGVGEDRAVPSLPVEIDGISTAIDVEVLGAHHVCVLLADATVECWGEGAGMLPATATPAPVPGFTDVVELEGSCALIGDGTVRCFDGGEVEDTLYIPPGITNAVAIDGNCALLSDETVKCWGWNHNGQLGIGSTDTLYHPPTAVPGLTGATDITGGGFPSCAVRADTTAVCWGGARWGNTGNGTAPDAQPNPIPVTGLTGVTAIDSGGSKACATMADGTARCWGFSYFGSIGNNAFHVTFIGYTTPQVLVGVTNAVQISLDEGGGCALLADGTVRCWGNGALDGAVDVFDGIDYSTPYIRAAVVPVTISGLD